MHIATAKRSLREADSAKLAIRERERERESGQENADPKWPRGTAATAAGADLQRLHQSCRSYLLYWSCHSCRGAGRGPRIRGSLRPAAAPDRPTATDPAATAAAAAAQRPPAPPCRLRRGNRRLRQRVAPATDVRPGQFTYRRPCRAGGTRRSIPPLPADRGGEESRPAHSTGADWRAGGGWNAMNIGILE